MNKNFIILGLFLTLSTLAPAIATSLLPISLQQLSSRASLIFYAEVIDNTVKKDSQSGHIATFTKFKIIDLIKGDSDSTHTIKQLGGHDKTSNRRLLVHGVPTFQPGKQYIVFLPEESSLGFCSPLGLHQGSFPVFTEDDELVVNNGHHITDQQTTEWSPENARSVQVPLAVRADKPSQSRLADFINTVRAFNTQ